MKPIRVNVDYDEVLATGIPTTARILALEFLAFWIVRDRPIRVHRDYPVEYLDHIERHTGHRPDLRSQGSAENWWGELRDIALEKRINSKVWSFSWWSSRWPLAGHICHSLVEAQERFTSSEWILKRAQGMSGRGHRVLKTAADFNSLREEWFQDGAILEPLRERVSDLSALWLPDEEKYIFYRNQIDHRFQWRSVRIEQSGQPRFTDEEIAAMGPWMALLEELRSEIQGQGYRGPFSVDAFFYHECGALKFHPCSEINARKTMGWIAYQFHQWKGSEVGELSLEPKKLNFRDWMILREQIPPSSYLLSPPDAPFLWIWKSVK